MTRPRRSVAHAVVVAEIATLVLATAGTAGPWTRAYVRALPDEAFAVVHVRPDGTRARHLPHHAADGRVDLPHLRSALVRLNQVHWEDAADADRARQHLQTHEDALGTTRRRLPLRLTPTTVEAGMPPGTPGLP